MAKKKPASQVLVIGLGRFGASVARELVRLGHEVLGVDTDMDVVQDLRDELTHVVQADATNPQALKDLDVSSFDRVVVGIGTNVEASILITTYLVEMEAPTIWAKALTQIHGRILKRVGAHHVTFPEWEMGERVAHMVAGPYHDFLHVDEHYSLAEIPAPRCTHGKTPQDVQGSYSDVKVVAVKHAGNVFHHAESEDTITDGDFLVVAGPRTACEEFARLE